MMFTQLSVLLLSSIGVVSAGGGFVQSCRNVGIYASPEILYADCKNYQGVWHYTELPMNRFLTNRFGVAHWQRDGGAMNSCNKYWGVSVEHGDGYVILTCNDGAGTWEHSDIFLNEHIMNIGGDLIYDGYSG